MIQEATEIDAALPCEIEKDNIDVGHFFFRGIIFYNNKSDILYRENKNTAEKLVRRADIKFKRHYYWYCTSYHYYEYICEVNLLENIYPT